MSKYDETVVEDMVDDEDIVNHVLEIITEFDEPEKEDILETINRILERWDNGFYND